MKRARAAALPAALLALTFGVSAARAQPATGAPSQGGPEAPDAAYVLGPDDELQIDALGHPDFQVRGRIGPDGTIQIPYLGVVQAADRNATALGEQLAKQLDAGGYFVKPIVRVQIVNYGARNVTVLGQVQSPGVIPVGRRYRLSEILARVGGAREDAADYIIVRPVKGPEHRHLIRDLAVGELDQDPYVVAGDKIFVPKAEMFYVSGQVKTPGAFSLQPGMTLRMAIARGGGLTDLGSDHQIKLTRSGRVVRQALDEPIQPGDVIVVGERLF